ncbi:prephenate dehydrogenase [Marinigracilibium pacificum]|uniref:Prephenate dehydrogenase n=1 Tax=Marinigracilibium pacificum TaxID=2729599 RepID=A0A848J3E2_9BACT|nr:prephenate dehydrogenase [Marinigracilibium pacificum]NMM50025.1 prephenate dehydrogenase [Marinigracilibium pacificum]
MNIGIIGLGLIGGSLGLSLQKNGHNVTGFDKNRNHTEKAHEFGLISDFTDKLDDLTDNCDVIIICTPVEHIDHLVNLTLSKTSSDQIIIDCGSTKKDICSNIDSHEFRDRFVAGHPIAGTEFSGPSAALPDLFSGKKMIFCDIEKSNERAKTIALQLFSSLGMQLLYMTSEEHDKHLAYVSHLSHVSSFALSLTALEIEKNDEQILNLSGSGFASTVRLAKSNPDTWTSIFLSNKRNLLIAVEEYQNQLQRIKDALIESSDESLKELITDAGKIRKILK